MLHDFMPGTEEQLASGMTTGYIGFDPTASSLHIGNLATMSPQDLMTRLQSAPVVRCDEVAWRFLGLSMAAWNAVFSAGLAVVWGMAVRRA